MRLQSLLGFQQIHQQTLINYPPFLYIIPEIFVRYMTGLGRVGPSGKSPA
jgi:hypothetical protein